MNVTFTGKIIAAEPLQSGTSATGNQWSSQNYVIEELNQQYPSKAVFQVFGADKIQQFALQVGEVATVHLGFRANQSTKDGRWYNKLDCWKVDKLGAQNVQGQPIQQTPPQQGFQQPAQGFAQPQGYQAAQNGLPF